jgi:hypothetical protein
LAKKLFMHLDLSSIARWQNLALSLNKSNIEYGFNGVVGGERYEGKV